MIGIAGNTKVEAGLWDNNKDGILMVIKGAIMFWIINLMTKNNTGDSDESFLTSTIKNGLNLGEEETVESQEVVIESETESEINITDILEDKEQEMLWLVNSARRKKGLKELKFDLTLARIARLKAEDMITNNYFAHKSPNYGTPFEMLALEGIDYGLAGENLAEAKNIERAFKQLMESPAHKDNILDKRYDKIGIGVKEGGPYGLMIVQLFTDLPDPAR